MYGETHNNDTENIQKAIKLSHIKMKILVRTLWKKMLIQIQYILQSDSCMVTNSSAKQNGSILCIANKTSAAILLANGLKELPTYL